MSPAWIDYNGHMSEHRYLQVFGDTTDGLLRLIGVDMAYAEAGAQLLHGRERICGIWTRRVLARR